MKLTHVRNATALLQAAGKRILIDPMLGAKHAEQSAPTEVGTQERNPLVDLTVPLADLLDVDIVVVTHTHFDHWDQAAAALLRRDVPVVVQHEADQSLISAAGFVDVRVLEGSLTIGDVRFTRTEGQHGADSLFEAIPDFGKVMGVVVEAAGEPTVYFAGDTIWHEGVDAALTAHEPEVIVLNTGEATIVGDEVILMGKEDVVRVHERAPGAQIVAVHMEALNHCITRREDVRALAAAHGIAAQVHVPEDGDVLEFA